MTSHPDFDGFTWYRVNPAAGISAFVEEENRRGIYILEFANSERYVGQATNVVNRFTQHRHGSTQHGPWKDIVGFGFRPIATGDLDVPERAMIAREKGRGVKLRNKVWNIGHDQPSPLDQFVPIEYQEHWANGKYQQSDPEQFIRAANRKRGPQTKLLASRKAKQRLEDGRIIHDVVIDELAQLIENVIPMPVETEKKFWTLSDCPKTSGGRFATLNVGNLELAYFPSRDVTSSSSQPTPHPRSMINAMDGTFSKRGMTRTATKIPPYSALRRRFKTSPVRVSTFSYSGFIVDRADAPLGNFGAAALESSELEGVRKLAIVRMRGGNGTVFRKFHSDELTRLVYERIVERHEGQL